MSVSGWRRWQSGTKRQESKRLWKNKNKEKKERRMAAIRPGKKAVNREKEYRLLCMQLEVLLCCCIVLPVLFIVGI